MDVGDAQGESGAPCGKDAGRGCTCRRVKDEDAARGVIWPFWARRTFVVGALGE